MATRTRELAFPSPPSVLRFLWLRLGKVSQPVPGQDCVSQPRAEHHVFTQPGSAPGKPWEAGVLPNPGVC